MEKFCHKKKIKHPFQNFPIKVELPEQSKNKLLKYLGKAATPVGLLQSSRSRFPIKHRH